MSADALPEVAYESAKRGANGGKLHLVPDCRQLASTTPREVSLDTFPPAHRDWCSACGPDDRGAESESADALDPRGHEARQDHEVAGEHEEVRDAAAGGVDDQEHGATEDEDAPREQPVRSTEEVVGGRVGHSPSRSDSQVKPLGRTGGIHR